MTDDRSLDRNWLEEYPQAIRSALKKLAGQCREVYVTGGAVRDWLSGKRAIDLDLTVTGDGLAAARFLAEETGGAFVPLDERERVGRVVAGGLTIDISSFREGTSEISADLSLRDFSINAMGVALDPASGTLLEPLSLIDPLGGAADLAKRLVRAPSADVFGNDPLRLLRAYRFAACLSFTIEPRTEGWITPRAELISRPAPERINHELTMIMAGDRSAATVLKMHESGILGVIFPELLPGKGLLQPASHHLDVLDHNLAALAAIEKIIGDPAAFFPEHPDHFRDYLAVPPHPALLKWAALFHDLGKPKTCEIREDGRTTFYNHDRAGAEIFTGIGRRLRWSRGHLRTVAGLIELHMYPFHLSNAIRESGITPRACLRLVKAVGEDLPGLFMLAMADSLASRGPLRPIAMEDDLAGLYGMIDKVYRESIRPVLSGPPLLDGHDLKRMGLAPGPLFGRILAGLEQARVAGEIGGRGAAEDWVRDFLAADSEK
ncbi:MAG: HDIG domain-containing protein [Desulfurivibrionaceae bacterium]|nr:HDIG domain-containing protein [Desulfobulbales bacterium]MDT8335393.1 HDIG domain-containing protein [Desulfurivibrionaceae bacterium]